MKTGAEHLKGENGYENSFFWCGYLNCRPSALLLASNATGTSAIINAKATIPDKRIVGKVVHNLTWSILILKKREFPLLLNIPEQLRVQTLNFSSTLGQGRVKEGRGKKRGQK